MAFNPDGVTVAHYVFEDNNGNRSGVQAYFSGALLWADALVAAGQLATDLAAISDAKLTGYTLSVGLVNDDATIPDASSEVERKLSITLGNATYPYLTSMSVPSPRFVIEQPRTDAPDPTNGLWVALQSQLTNGGLGGGNGVTSYRAEDVTRITRAAITHRARKPRV